MIAYLEGKLRHKSPDHLVVDVHGVGYCVHVPLSTFYDLPDLGQTACLYIHTHVREDALQLYGFRSQAEKEMFLHLVSVNGVGPKLAVSILSGITPDELRRVVLQQDSKRLRSIPGVGRKIAERLVLELRDYLRIKKEDIEGPVCLHGEDGPYADAYSALLNLGYRSQEASRALQTARKTLDTDPTLERLLKEALRLLA
ncbi:MAG TPA: Holliday junction branch migration protein RuvA [Syntrophobacteraceae bacterium]|nr:Holliday junction branch migration protein RuvA [Syntrophobacteraceae bacterium]